MRCRRSLPGDDDDRADQSGRRTMIVFASSYGPLIQWSWVRTHGGEIGTLLVQHLVLTGLAVGIGFVISLPLAVLAIRYRRSYAPITWITGIMYTIPSIALFGILVPYTGYTILTA